MAIGPTVTPYALLQALDQSRRRGGPSDYYGLGASLRNVGQSYLDLNRQAQSGIDTANQYDARQANTAAGYFPALAAQSVASANLNTETKQQQLQEMQDVQRAHQEAVAKGLQYGTLPYQQYMQSHVNSAHYARQQAPEVAAAQMEVRNKAFAESYVQKAVQQQLTKEVAKEQFKRLTANQSLTPDSIKDATQQAWDFANKHVRDAGLQVKFAPDGTLVASDNNGQTIPIPPEIGATALAAMGDKIPQQALQAVDTATRNAYADLRANMNTANGLDAKGKPLAGTTAKGAKTTDEHTQLLDQLKLYVGHRKDFKTEDLTDPRKQAAWDQNEKRIQQIEAQFYGAPTGAGAVDPAAPGGTSPSVGLNPDFLYGNERGDETSSIPDIQPQTAPPPGLWDRLWGNPNATPVVEEQPATQPLMAY